MSEETVAEINNQHLEIDEFVSNVLPNIPREKIQFIISELLDHGIYSIDDFKFIDKSILYQKVQPVFVNKLVTAYEQLSVRKATTSEEVNDPQPGPSNANSAPTSAPLTPFTLDYARAGLDINNTDITLDESMKSEICRALVKQVKEAYGGQNPGANVFRDLAKNVALKFPTFYDICDGVRSSSTLLFADRMINHGYYKRRKNRGENQQKKRPRKSDTVGVSINEFNPDMPEGDNPEMHEEIRIELKVVHQMEKNDWNIPDIIVKVDKAYSTIRKFILDNHSMSKIKEEWPFLFHHKILIHQFKKLTKKDPADLIQQFILNEADDLITFLTKFSSKNYEAAKVEMKFNVYCQELSDPPSKLMTIFKMITKYMVSDNFKHMLALYKDMANLNPTDDEIEEYLRGLGEENIAAPRILGIANKKWTCKDFCVVAENVVIARLATFEDAFAVLISVIWVFNFVFPTSLNSSYDFFQRFVLKITEGTKCDKKGKGTCPDIRVKTQALLKEFKDFKTLRENVRSNRVQLN